MWKANAGGRRKRFRLPCAPAPSGHETGTNHYATVLVTMLGCWKVFSQKTLFVLEPQHGSGSSSPSKDATFQSKLFPSLLHAHTDPSVPEATFAYQLISHPCRSDNREASGTATSLVGIKRKTTKSGDDDGTRSRQNLDGAQLRTNSRRTQFSNHFC